MTMIFFFLEKEIKQPALKYTGKPNDNLKLSDVSYRSWRLGSLYDTENGKHLSFVLCYKFYIENLKIFNNFFKHRNNQRTFDVWQRFFHIK